jgi:hypothetical protein
VAAGRHLGRGRPALRRAPPGRPSARRARIDQRTYFGFGLYSDRLRRDGWTHDGKPHPGGGKAFAKPFGKGWTLRKKVVNVTETHQLATPKGAIVPQPTWEWAEVDEPRQRVVYAEGGLLWAARIGRDGLDEPRPIFDARPMQFEPLVAPYDDVVVFGR